MPRDKKFVETIPELYRMKSEDTALLFFIKGQLQLAPTMTIDQAMKNYLKLTGLTIDDWDMECMRSTYNRLNRIFWQSMKS